MDTRIALGVQPLSIPDQSAPLQKALTLRALMGQGDMQELQLQEGQRAMRRNTALDEAASSSTSDDDYLARLSKIDPAAAIKLKHDRLTQQKTETEVNDARMKQKAQLAGAFSLLPPDQQQALYPKFRADWNALNIPGDKIIENEAWDPVKFLPNIKRIAAAGLSPEKAMERGDYAATAGQPTAAAPVPGMPPAVAALSGQPQVAPMPVQPADVADPDSGATVRALQGDTMPPPVPVTQNQAPAVAEIRHPEVPVTAKPPALSPDDLRAQAAQKRALGTKAGADVAKDLDAAANQLESRILQEQGLEQSKKQGEEAIRVREEAIAARKSNQGNQVITNTGKLADDFRQEQGVKEYRTVQPLVASMENAYKKSTAASDLDLIYAIAKIFDPGSVVREGEQIMVVNAGGLPSQIQSALGFVAGGQRLSAPLRQELLDQARSRADNYKQAYDSVAASYRGTAQRFGLNPDDIVRDYKVSSRGALTEGKGPIKQGAGSGARDDPFKIKGEDGYSTIKSGEFYVDPNDPTKIRQKR